MRINIFQIGLFSCLLIGSPMAIAKFPTRCHMLSIKFTHDLLIMSNKTNHSQVFLLQNISANSLILNHPLRPDPGAGAGWASLLQPQKFSAILVPSGKFALNCQQKLPHDRYVTITCKKVLKACQLPMDSVAKTDGFWVGENKSICVLLSIIKKRLRTSL